MNLIIQLFISLILFYPNNSFSNTTKRVTATELFAQKINIALIKLSVASNNIANLNTTRTAEGGFYKKRIVESCSNGQCNIVKSNEAPIIKYIPGHPDSDSAGNVEFPRIDEEEELKKIQDVGAIYEDIIQEQQISTVEFLIGNSYEDLFYKYKKFGESMDKRAYLNNLNFNKLTEGYTLKVFCEDIKLLKNKFTIIKELLKNTKVEKYESMIQYSEFTSTFGYVRNNKPASIANNKVQKKYEECLSDYNYLASEIKKQDALLAKSKLIKTDIHK